MRYCAMLVVACVSALGAPQNQSFEVASIRLEDAHSLVDYNSFNQPQPFPTNRSTIRHTYLKSLIASAYGVEYLRIVGGPPWIDVAHYDLNAKAEGDARLTRKQMQPLLQTLLKERFHLAVHSETRTVPGYVLVVAKGGPRLNPTKGAAFGGIRGIDQLKFQNESVEGFAQSIGDAIKQPVVDRSGLIGKYDFDVKFAPEDPAIDSPNAKYGSIFSALEEQLGLKLVAQKVPVTYLVIDHVEKVPVEN